MQFKEALTLGLDIRFSGVSNIIVCGMGGSALSAEFIKSIFYPNAKIFVLKDYVIPDYIDDSWLCVCVSYSGNTEETISAYNQAVKKTRNVLAVSSGGRLEELSKKNHSKLILVPKGLQPRMAVAYQTIPILGVFVRSKLLKYDLVKESKKVFSILSSDFEKKALQIVSLMGKGNPIIYSSSANEALAFKWKISFNENAKIPAFYNVFPEFNHNELNGFKNSDKSFCIILLRDKEDNIRVKKRFDIISKLLKEQGFKVIDVDILGDNRLSKIFFGSLLADWVSCIYAKSIGEDSLPVPIIEELKKELSKK